MAVGERQSQRAAILTAARPYLLALAFTALVGGVTARHEMWRDEVQTWLLVRASPNPLAVLSTIKYEGHPALWHLLLWPFARLSADPVWMQVVHVLIAGVTALVWFRYAPFSWPIKIATMLGYYFVYEWGVVARNYGLSALLLCGCCALYDRRWTRFPVLGLLLALLCHTNIYGLLIALTLLLTLAVEFAVAYVKRWRDAEKCLGRVLAGFALGALGLYTGIRQMAPPPDSGSSPTWYLEWNTPCARAVATTVFNAYLPASAESAYFWNAHRWLGPESADNPHWRIPPERYFHVAAGILLAGGLFFLARPWLLVPYAGGTVALLTFFYTKYTGGWRHHGLLYLLFLALLWISFHYRPWQPRARWAAGALSFWDRHRMKVLAPLLAFHVWCAWVAVAKDWTYTFSQGGATAAWLKTRFPDRDAVFFVGHQSPHASAVFGHLGPARIYYPDRDDFGSYVIWDQKRNQPLGDQLLPRIARTIAREGKDAVLVLSEPLPAPTLPPGLTPLRAFDDVAVTGERYFLYLWAHDQAATWTGGSTGS